MNSSTNKNFKHLSQLVFIVFLTVGFSTSLFALPQGGAIVAGQGNISQPNAGSMVIHQGTDQMITNWQGFSIGESEGVQFIQPNVNSVVLNRVIGNNPSSILGSLSSNGKIFLSNPSGILFGKNARVNVGSLFATTLSISDLDFMNRNYKFKASPNKSLSSIINEGRIEAASGGYIGLLAPSVHNRGTIIANLGSVILASGQAATIDFFGDGLINLKITEAVEGTVLDNKGNVLEDRILNSGTIQADGGQVILTAMDASSVIRNVVNNSGRIKAQSIVKKNGEIYLVGGKKGKVVNTGTLDVSAVEVAASAGNISIEGSMIGQFGEVHADALEGDGGNISLWASDVVSLSSDSSTTANAGLNGDGGEVIVFSPDTALFWGNAGIEAKGGSLSGNGGFVEVSGREHVEVYGLVDTSAPYGKAGIFFIDPANVSLSTAGDANGSFGGGDPNTWTPNAATSVVDADAQLALSSVIVNTNFNGGEAGNISVDQIITDSTGNSLTLQAANDIILNQDINLGGGAGNLTLNADWGGGDVTSDGTGAIINGGGTLTMGTGNLLMIAGSGIGTSGANITTSGLTNVAATTATGGIFISNSNSGDINITSIGGTNGLTTTTIGKIEVTNTGGNITVASPVTTMGVVFNADEITLNATTGTYTQNDVDISSGNADINIIADSVVIKNNSGSNAFNTSQSLYIRPFSMGTTMSLAGSSTFDLTQAEITDIEGGASTYIEIGSFLSTALMTVGSAINLGSSVSLVAGSISDGGNVFPITNPGRQLNLYANSGAIGGSGTNEAIDVDVSFLTVNTQSNNNAYISSSQGYSFSSNPSSVGTGILNLVSAGNITDLGGSSITAGTLIATLTGASSDLTLDSGLHAITNLGAITAPGGFTLDNGNNSITVTDAITTTDNNVSIDVGTGTYTQNDVDISSGSGDITITADVVDIVDNTGDNAFNTTGWLYLKPFSAGTTMSLAGSSTFDLTQTEITDVVGGASGTAIGSISSTAPLTIGSAINFGSNDVSLRGGSITDGGNIFPVTAGTLGLIAMNGAIGGPGVNSEIDISVTNLVLTTADNNAYITSTQGFNLGYPFTGILVGTGTLSLTAAGDITDSVPIIAGTLAATLTGASSDLTLDSGLHAITNLGAITAPGGFTLDNGNNSINVTGAITTTDNAINIDSGTGTFTSNAGGTLASGSGDITITADSISLGDSIVGTGILNLVSAGDITDIASSSITVGTLTAILTGASSNLTLDSGLHSITNLGPITAPGGFTLDNGNNSITITGAITTTNSPVNIDVGTGTYTQNNVDIASGSGVITITADVVDITDNTGDNAFQSTFVTLMPGGASTTMSLAGSSTFDLTQEEITDIGGGVVSGFITIGSSLSTAVMTIGSSVNFGGNTGWATLNAGSFTDGGNVYPITVAGSLRLEAGNGAIGESGLNEAIDIMVPNGFVLNTQGGNDAYISSTQGYVLFPSNVGTGILNLVSAGDITGIGSSTTAGTLTANLTGASSKLTLDSGTHAITNLGPITAPGGFSLDNGNNSVTVTGAIMTTDNAIRIDSGAGTFTSNAGGTLASGSGDITITADLISLGDTIVNTGTLSLTSAGDITSSIPIIAGTLEVSAGVANNITLDSAGNDFGTAIITTGNNVTLVDTNAIDIGASFISGTLTVTATGTITDSGPIAVAGTTTLAAGTANDIILDDVNNDFTGAVSITSGRNVTLVDANSIDLGASTVSGTLMVTAGGDVTDSGTIIASALTVDTTGAATGGAITLDAAGTDVDTISLSSGNNSFISFVDINGVDVALANAGAGNVSITAGGNVTDSGTITASLLMVNTTGAATGGAITLNTSTNDVNTFNFTSGNNSSISFTDVDGVDIALADSGTGSLTINAGGNVTDSGTIIASALTVDTTGAATGGAITLDAAGTDVDTISLFSGNNSFISFVDTDAVDIALVNAGTGNVSITAGGNVTDSGTITASLLTVNTTGAAAGGTITLNTSTNDVNTVHFTSGNNSSISFTDVDGVDIALADSGTGSLTIDAGGVVTVSGSLTSSSFSVSTNSSDFSLNVPGSFNSNIDLDAGTGSVAFAAGGDVTLTGSIRGSSLSVNTAAAGTGGAISLLSTANDFDTINLVSGNNSNISFADADGVDIALANAGTGNITITSGGDVTNSGPITASILTVDTTEAASGGAITLDYADNDINVANLASGNNSPIVLVDADGVDIDLTDAGTGDVTIKAGGDVTDPGNTIKGGTVSIDSAGSITLDSTSNVFSQLNLSSASDITIDYTGDLVLGEVLSGGNIVLRATGDILSIGGITASGDFSSYADIDKNQIGAFSLNNGEVGSFKVRSLNGKIYIEGYGVFGVTENLNVIAPLGITINDYSTDPTGPSEDIFFPPSFPPSLPKLNDYLANLIQYLGTPFKIPELTEVATGASLEDLELPEEGNEKDLEAQDEDKEDEAEEVAADGSESEEEMKSPLLNAGSEDEEEKKKKKKKEELEGEEEILPEE